MPQLSGGLRNLRAVGVAYRPELAHNSGWIRLRPGAFWTWASPRPHVMPLALPTGNPSG